MTTTTLKRLVVEYPAVLFLTLLCATFAVTADRFLTIGNAQNIGRQSAVVAILAIGMTLTMLTGGIDLSVGSIAALSGALGAWLAADAGWGTWWGILFALGVGATAGAINGLLITKVGIVPFVATLASLTAYRSATLLVTDGRPIVGLDATFRSISQRHLVGLPLPLFIALVIAALCFGFLRFTPFGTRIYAVGGGADSARLAGLRVDRITIGVYVASGVAAAIGGVLLTSRVASAQPNAATGIELDVITAAVLGGVSLFGGKGRVIGAISGAVTITVLGNGLNLMQVDAFLQQIAKGVALMIAVLLATRASRDGKSLVRAIVPSPIDGATSTTQSRAQG